MEKYSVLMSLYKKEHPEYLRLALDSMINQTVKPDEIVLVEDGPLTDELYVVVNEYKDKLTLVINENNLGLGLALNEGCDYYLYRFSTTGLRFFTVYGPWGRTDMAMFKFTKAILEGNPIDVYNHGNLSRDFTYIDDIVEGICRIVGKTPEQPEYRLYNIGHGSPVQLLDFIRAIEKVTGKKAILNMKEMQKGDVVVKWYREFYGC